MTQADPQVGEVTLSVGDREPAFVDQVQHGMAAMTIPPVWSDQQLLEFKQVKIDQLERQLEEAADNYRDVREQLALSNDTVQQQGSKLADALIALDGAQISIEEWMGKFNASDRARLRLASDCEQIAAALLHEAQRREWCDEYDSFVTSLNEDLTQRWFSPCNREMTFTYTVTVGVTGPRDKYEAIGAELTEYLHGATEGVQTDVDDVSVSVQQR